VLLRSLTNYFNHRIAYDDVAQTNHTIASIRNRLRCEKACPLPWVLIRSQIFTLASFEHQLMTVWMLVSKQNIFTDDNLLTHSVLLQSIQPRTFSLF